MPFNESIGSELYRACGLLGPSWKALHLSDFFIDSNRSCWMETPNGRLRPVPGPSFGSRFLGGGSAHLWEVLPQQFFSRVRNRNSFWLAWLIDICADHIDNRQALFLEDVDGSIEALFVDHGHLFGGPKGGQQTHFQASRYLDPRIYQGVSSDYVLRLKEVVASLDTDHLWRWVQNLPDEWRTPSAIEGLGKCLTRLSTGHFLDCVLDTIADSGPRNNDHDNYTKQAQKDATRTVLCLGVPGARRRESARVRCTYRSVCP